MNVLNFPEGQRPKTTETSPWYRVYRTAAWYKCFFWVSCEEIFTTKSAKGQALRAKGEVPDARSKEYGAWSKRDEQSAKGHSPSAIR
jgi:hypothetical protein